MASDKITLLVNLDDKSIGNSFKNITASGVKASNKLGKSFSKNVSGTLDRGLSSATKKVVALGAAFVAAFAARRVIQAAAQQEDAINSLNSALKISGKFTQAASQNFQSFASQLQQTSKFGDEVILQNAALLQSLGNLSVDGLKEATQASADMAAALNIDLRAAITLVGKAAAGEIGSFSRYGVIVKRGADNAETLKNTIKSLNKQFGGAALAQLNTFSGATAQLENTFGDLLEEIGFLITKNPQVIASIKALGNGFRELITFVKDNNTVLVSLATDGFNLVIQASSLMAQGVLFSLEAILKLDAAVKKIVNASIVGDLNAQMEEARRMSIENGDKITMQLAKQKADQLAIAIDATKKNTDLESAEVAKRIAVLEGFRDKVSVLASQIASATKPTVPTDGIATPALAEVPKLSPVDQQALDSLTLFGVKLNSARAEGNKFAIDWAKVTTSIKNNAVQGIGKGVGGGFAAMGAALAKGENAIEAFGKAFAASIGQAAIQLGTRFILEGIAISFNPLLGGPAVGGPLIGAGAALAAFGGALGAVVGGGGATAGGGAGGGGGETGFSSDLPLGETEETKPQTMVTLNVNGDILDSQDTPRRLADLLNAGFDNEGLVLKGTA